MTTAESCPYDLHVHELDSVEGRRAEYLCRHCGDIVVVPQADLMRNDPYPLDPFAEAYGRAMMRAAALEGWLVVAAATLEERDRVEVEKERKAIENLGKRVCRRLPAEDRRLLGSVLRRARLIADARHDLAHGLWSNVEGCVWVSHRPPRHKGATVDTVWQPGVYDRRQLLQLGRDAELLSHTIEDNLPKWARALGLQAEGPFTFNSIL